MEYGVPCKKLIQDPGLKTSVLRLLSPFLVNVVGLIGRV